MTENKHKLDIMTKSNKREKKTKQLTNDSIQWNSAVLGYLTHLYQTMQRFTKVIHYFFHLLWNKSTLNGSDKNKLIIILYCSIKAQISFFIKSLLFTS